MSHMTCPKTMEEMMTVTTAFIRGEAAAASKKKGHLSWKSQDYSKRQATERKSDFRSQPREGQGSSRFTPLIKTPKKILATETGKFKPPPQREPRDNWRRGSLYKSVDGFHDRQINFAIQRYHWETGHKRNPSSAIHSHGIAVVSGRRGIDDYPFHRLKQGMSTGLFTLSQKLTGKEYLGGYLSRSVLLNKDAFGLKERWAPTYQRLVDKAFDSQVGRNMEVYVDDLVIKSHTEAEMLRDIGETFPVQRSLMTERGTVQKPVYFISRALQGLELNYTPMEKLVLSLVFASKRLRRYFQAHPIAFTASNNEAEMKALIAGLSFWWSRWVVQNVQAAKINVGLQLVARPWSWGLPRSKNKKAEALSKIALTSFAHCIYTKVLVEDGTLPGDRKEASKLRIKARQYELMEGTLYRRSFLKPWLRCLGPLQASYVIREIHEGSCSMHAGPRSVVAKAMRLGYYWSTMHRDARDMIRACNDCQVHRPVPRNPQQPLTPITAPWPFYKWGIDIAAPWFQQVHKS
ncbi:reverse transcriptase domain-containing protein [Tanacetum coccineum]